MGLNRCYLFVKTMLVILLYGYVVNVVVVIAVLLDYRHSIAEIREYAWIVLIAIMLLRLTILFALFTSSLQIYNNNPGPLYPPTKGAIWPKPMQQESEGNYFTVNPSNIKIKVTSHSCPILEKAINRYSFIVRNINNVDRYIRRHRKKTFFDFNNEDTANFIVSEHRPEMKELDVELKSPCEEYPHFNMDEAYTLTISTKSKLTSSSIWGILRGLESWSQLFYFADDFSEVRINATRITDSPRFPHRGLLLDTGRHYISLNNILRTLDAMAMNKMNVFHWHIVDDQSFPYQSEKFPGLSAKGAYHPSMIYTKEDIENVIQYATNRGIRVIPEFDVPGHTRSWGVAYPDILAECYSEDEVVGLGPMDPTKDSTYKLLRDLIHEVQTLFPDLYFHIGGDEVQLDCWESNPRLQEYIKEHNMTVSQLHSLFMRKVIPLLGENSQSIVWQEVFDEGVHLSPDRTIIQVWKNGWVDEMIRVLMAGFKLIFSASWYLDHLKQGGDWEDYFVADPRDMVSDLNETLINNIVGGEACMWGEVVDDTNVITRVWPRASAVAERLWSPAYAPTYMTYVQKYLLRKTVLDEARHRLEEHTCRMRRRGIHAQPPNGAGFCVGAI